MMTDDDLYDLYLDEIEQKLAERSHLRRWLLIWLIFLTVLAICVLVALL